VIASSLFGLGFAGQLDKEGTRMKRYTLIGLAVMCLVQQVAMAETEEEEMARMQRELNSQVFGVTGANEPPPPAAPAPPPAPAPVVAAPASDSGGLPLATFTGYTLAGLHLSMEESAVLDSLKASGYACNLPQAQQMAFAMGGRKVCIFISQEAPKFAIVGFRNGQLSDLETHEMYRTEFPEEFFKRAKKKFMASYSDSARCKQKDKGEICEVFGHGYRILLRNEASADGVKIVHRVGRI
jgi:hypothetical protein